MNCWFGAKMAVVAVMMILLVSGCSTPLSQIRENEPYHTLTSTKSPRGLAKCIELEARQSQIGAQFAVALEEYPNETYRVAITLPAYTAMADILVKPTNSGSVVEFRKKGWFYLQTQILEIIERSAK